jgi:hypothetical protein
VAEADDDLLRRHAPADIGFRFVGIAVSLLISSDTSLAPPCFGPRSAPMPPVIALYMSEPVPAMHAAGEGAGVVLVLGVEDERGVHRPHPGFLGLLAVQQVQVVTADRVVVGDRVDAFSGILKMKPVQEHGAERSHQPVGDVPRALGRVLLVLGLERAEHRAAGPHHVHRMRALRQLLQRPLQGLRQPAQALQLALVFFSSSSVGSFS